MTKIEYCAATHSGKRERNEDSHLALPDYGVWVVADGMGGHGSGDIASQITVSEIARHIRQNVPLVESIALAHEAIRTAAANCTGNSDMGTTVVALKLDGLHYEMAWVGDSRAYLWNGALQQLTTDHSYIQLLLDKGMITPTEALTHSGRNIVIQALGVGGMNRMDINIAQVFGKINSGDSLLLCSDGLTGEVSDTVIATILSGESSNEDKVNRLINTALANGGKDNVTVIVITAA